MSARPGLLLPLLLLACATTPEVKAPSEPAAVAKQEISLTEQGLTDFTVSLQGEVASPEVPATLLRARYELVADGEVVKAGEQELGVEVPAGGSAPFSLTQQGAPISKPEELEALSERGGNMLVALRGELEVERAGRVETLPFARSREVRVPRLPVVRLSRMDGARYSEERVVMNALLSVTNPNPFPVRLTSLTYQAHYGGKLLDEGVRARGATLAPSSTDSYEVQVNVHPETYGPEAKALIAKRVIPYRLEGKVSGEQFEVPFVLEGEVRLNVSQ
jgi:LEA14-like dessication related protein